MTASSKPLILIIEDEPDLVTLLQYTLEKEGFRTAVGNYGEEAMLFAEEHVPDLVLLDWMLPLMSGITVCRRFRETPATRTVPIILLTARSEEADRERGFEAGADDYVAKPFSPAELVVRIRTALSRPRAHRRRPAGKAAMALSRHDRIGREPVVGHAEETVIKMQQYSR